MLKPHDGGAGAAGQGAVYLSQIFRGLLSLILLYCCLVIGGGFPLLKADGPCGALGQAVAKAVAEVLPHQPGLAIHHVDGALMAGLGAKTAAIAFFFVYMNDLSNHADNLLAFLAKV